ncbi:ROK family transcriptional regulator [Pseudarthrobacter enclensis]|uniref:NBD/HSP70 family sugar kinase n=1 Tax=Pseudarthrobacter enclensis TaxID=993070 RepID=A0ABT9RXA9_9MICC|nr:ROK family transcriptional regulator [Pseudarthrobacter enclensis]MDP9889878.1 putative NBD/HSP70 family sugar kinase [Pseudarthrobacter enclensis]
MSTRKQAFGVPALKDPHRSGLFSLVLRHAPISRVELARQASLDPSTIARTLRPLVDQGYVVEAPTAPSGRGRPERLLEVVAGKHTAVGIKIGPRVISGVVTDLGANVLARGEDIDVPLDPVDTFRAVAALVDRLLTSVPGAREKALGVGVAVSGHVDPDAGTCRYSPILGWRGVDVAKPLAELTALPVTVHNDVNALAVAEHLFGDGRNARNFAVVTLGPGVGLGLVIDGKVYGGAHGTAGELGHIPLVPDGPLCSCGRRGCLEALAGDAAIASAAGATDVDAAMELARTGSGSPSAGARSAFAAAGGWIGRGLAVVCNLAAPELIVITGEGSAAYDLLGEGLTASLKEYAFEGEDFLPRLKVAAPDADLWGKGAACLAIQRSLS